MRSTTTRATTADQGDFKSVPYELFILLVSILSIVNLAIALLALTFIPIASATGDVVATTDVLLTFVFLGDFLYRLLSAPKRRRYFFRGFGWLDFLAVFPILRVLRAYRIVRTVRWMRSMGRHRVLDELADRRASATFLVTIFLVIVVVEVTGASIFAAESADPSANIKTAGDAIWWGLVTITTVGYGDRYPVTPAGRAIGVFLLFAGIALFSVLTGFIANSFLAPRRRRQIRREPDDPRASIATLRDLLAEQDDRTQQLRERVDELERSLSRNAPS